MTRSPWSISHLPLKNFLSEFRTMVELSTPSMKYVAAAALLLIAAHQARAHFLGPKNKRKFKDNFGMKKKKREGKGFGDISMPPISLGKVKA
jgi:hypothetical protein